LIFWILLDDFASLQSLKDLIRSNDPKRLRLHLAPGVVGESAISQAQADLLVVHSLSESKALIQPPLQNVHSFYLGPIWPLL
jgi:hypothetical protein